MKTLIYQVQFFSYWHTGSGLAGGADRNLSVIKNQYGLPFIPGRTLKGLLREAAVIINGLNPALVSQSFIEQVFGVGEDHTGGEDFRNAACFFSNAELSKYLTDQITEEQKRMLFTSIASTAINEDGQARDESLRQVEATIPLSLYASIEHFPDDESSAEQMKRVMQWVKRMGQTRSRGWGCCKFSIKSID